MILKHFMSTDELSASQKMRIIDLFEVYKFHTDESFKPYLANFVLSEIERGDEVNKVANAIKWAKIIGDSMENVEPMQYNIIDKIV